MLGSKEKELVKVNSLHRSHLRNPKRGSLHSNPFHMDPHPPSDHQSTHCPCHRFASWPLDLVTRIGRVTTPRCGTGRKLKLRKKGKLHKEELAYVGNSCAISISREKNRIRCANHKAHDGIKNTTLLCFEETLPEGKTRPPAWSQCELFSFDHKY